MATNIRFAGVALIFAVSMLAPAAARASDTPQKGVWLASSEAAPLATLTLRDGKLSFRGTTAANSWEVDLSDAKRVELSKSTANAIEIEDGWGETYVVKILNSRLTLESPSKAFKMISNAMGDSVKVVRINGGQVR